MPQSFTCSSLQQSRLWLCQYVSGLVNHQFTDYGIRSNPLHLLTVLQAIARQPGRCNQNMLAAQLMTTSKAISIYLAQLDNLLLITKLPGYHPDLFKLIGKRSKYYVRDSGLAKYLSSYSEKHSQYPLATDLAELHWEGFAIENVQSVLPLLWQTYFYHTRAGKTIDLLIKKRGLGLWAVDIQQHYERPDSQFIKACAELQPERAFVVHSGTQQRKQLLLDDLKIEVLSLRELLLEITKLQV